MKPLALKYRSGEEIETGDRVLYLGNPASIEFVAFDEKDPETDWYVKEFGGGILIADPAVSGHTFIPADQIDEDVHLEFVSRGDSRA